MVGSGVIGTMILSTPFRLHHRAQVVSGCHDHGSGPPLKRLPWSPYNPGMAESVRVVNSKKNFQLKLW
jgi:hypothetical protein